MRLLRRQLVVFIGLGSMAAAMLLVRSVLFGATDEEITWSDIPAPDNVPVGSLAVPENASIFQTAPGVEPYPWQYFRLARWQRQVIEPGASDVQRAPRPGPETHELLTVLNASLAEVRRLTGSDEYSLEDSLGGRARLLPGVGVQYEVYFRTHDAVPGGFHTVRLRRALSPLSVQYAGKRGGQLINILLPYYHRYDTLDRFVGRFEKLVQEGQALVLTVVRYTKGFPLMEPEQESRDRARVVARVREANQRLGGAAPAVRLVEQRGTFSRGGALMAGAHAWDAAEDVLLFLCDVDMVFGRGLLQRCRANAEPGRAAYFPVVFSSYNPDIVYGVVRKKVVPVITNYERRAIVHRDLGYWIDFGFGMSCQYRSDFQRLSGAFLNITGWGLEDVRLYDQFRKSDVQIVRMPDPDLVHVYHKKQCSKYEVGKRFNSCLKSKALNEASRLEWGLWVYKNMGDTDDVEEFLKMFRGAQVPGGS